ncbi:Adenylate cyclase 1 [Sulfurospirillum diekertiae]|uniref:Adenylate cyclase 1 n=1 Tax=Sulfurospirillum diekertiae TaxID=1854492 RepID=A0A1Y0HPR6_9BACT|nr:adenylate/guanylate cyclase domain-containing protein [Sulfurospirillum diekertiae]ARU50117.1 Adenylate cyclase 1 [Sulfurospirillum diekertiae]
MRKSLLQLLFTFIVMAGSVVGYLYESSFWLPFEYKIKDRMLQSRGEITGDENIVIIDIDEKSLKTLGQWPWSRDKIARLLQNLSDLGVAIVGLDVVFAEADNSSPQKVLAQLGLPHKDVPDYDTIFAETIAHTPTVVGYVFALTPDSIQPEGNPKSAAILVEQNRPKRSSLIKPYRAILNIPQIQKQAYSSGYFNTIPDNDGIVRSVPLVMEYDGVLYPSLSLEMVRIALGEKKINIVYDENGLRQIEIGEHIIPTDFFGRLMVNYRGGQNSYRYISAIDVYNNRVDPLHVKDKIALLGTSAAGLLDLRSTPFESVYAGVEVHANAIDNMLHEDYISQPIWARGVDLLSIVILSIVTLVALLVPSAFFSFIALVILNLIVVITHYYCMVYQGILLNTILPLFAINILFIVGQAMNYFLEIRQKELIKHKFSSKVSPAVMNNILSSGDDILQGIEKEITIFFSDLRNFTGISEAAGEPKHLIHLMNAYMDPMSQIIIHQGGTVDKFIGDAIMAYWNAPISTPNHADKAVTAALQQLHHLKALNATIRTNPEFETITAMADQKGVPIIDIGIGINTGVAIVGEMGTSNRSDYTVIGDPINLGSRLESLCKYYHSHLTISHFTKNKLKGAYLFRFLDLVTVKGKHEPIEVWQIHDFDTLQTEPLYATSYEELQEELRLHHEAIELYRKADFTEALKCFEALNRRENKTNEAIYPLYIERCLHYIAFPPSSFNGVFVHTTKG